MHWAPAATPSLARSASEPAAAPHNQPGAEQRCSLAAALQVARSLAGLGVDETTVAAALLHDVLHDMLLPEAQLQRMLDNAEVFSLVKQVR